jgi:hypothetical protein
MMPTRAPRAAALPAAEAAPATHALLAIAATPPPLDDARRRLREAVWSEQDEALARMLGSDADAALIFEALRAGRLQEESPSARLLAKDFLRRMREDPSEGLRLVRVGLARIDLKSEAFDRLSLLETLKSVSDPAFKTEIRELAERELSQHPIAARPDPETAHTDEERAAAGSTSFEMAFAVSAFDVALSTLHEPGQALEMAMRGIRAQPDWGVRGGIASTLLAKFPATRDELRARLEAQDLRVPEAFLTLPTDDAEASAELSASAGSMQDLGL